MRHRFRNRGSVRNQPQSASSGCRLLLSAQIAPTIFVALDSKSRKHGLSRRQPKGMRPGCGLEGLGSWSDRHAQQWNVWENVCPSHQQPLGTRTKFPLALHVKAAIPSFCGCVRCWWRKQPFFWHVIDKHETCKKTDIMGSIIPILSSSQPL